MNELRQKGLGLAVISYDRPEATSAFSKARGITFPLLSDAGSATIKRYGILNPVPEWAIGPDKDDPEVKAAVQKYVSVVNPNASMVGIAFPGTFILDRQGRVKGLKVVSTNSNLWAQETAARMIRAAKFPPIPKKVIAEQGHDWVDVEAEWSFRI